MEVDCGFCHASYPHYATERAERCMLCFQLKCAGCEDRASEQPLCPACVVVVHKKLLHEALQARGLEPVAFLEAVDESLRQLCGNFRNIRATVRAARTVVAQPATTTTSPTSVASSAASALSASTSSTSSTFLLASSAGSAFMPAPAPASPPPPPTPPVMLPVMLPSPSAAPAPTTRNPAPTTREEVLARMRQAGYELACDQFVPWPDFVALCKQLGLGHANLFGWLRSDACHTVGPTNRQYGQKGVRGLCRLKPTDQEEGGEEEHKDDKVEGLRAWGFDVDPEASVSFADCQALCMQLRVPFATLAEQHALQMEENPSGTRVKGLCALSHKRARQ